jgi:serine/threonine protein kinase
VSGLVVLRGPLARARLRPPRHQAEHSAPHGGRRAAPVRLRTAREPEPSEQSLRRTGTSRRGPAGTWHYMPPEQQRGEAVGKAADVYSLGIVLAELTTGNCPEPKALAGPSTLEDCAALGDLPNGLRQLIRRCTPVDPGRRPADAGVLREEFEKAIASLA